jgi:cyanophycinase-like exopeptidase
MDIFRIFFLLLFMQLNCFSQVFTSFYTGNTTDTICTPEGGICLMGGAAENDEAMKWFLTRSGGGNVLVLRTSGADGYNKYMFEELGVQVHSVETIVFNNTSASYEPYIHQKIKQAEAIWFAGGDQWDYVRYWRDTPIDSLINDAVKNRHIVIGGTSAGMAIQGGFYFSAQHGTVTSEQALSNPYNTRMTVDSARFLKNEILQHVITDTHYDNPDRKGRHVAFLARIQTDWGIEAKGIACDEYSAVCIDPAGLAHCYGDGLADFTWFLQTNCALEARAPENCSSGSPLNWNRGNEAIKVYKINGTSTGNHTFDLKDWQTGSGGTWENWWVNQGTLDKQDGTQVNCATSVVKSTPSIKLLLYPNPATGDHLHIALPGLEITRISILDISGSLVRCLPGKALYEGILDVSGLNKGVYIISLESEHCILHSKIILQ